MSKPLVLCILDGVGISDDISHNAVRLAKMPFYNGLLEKYPHSELDASGVAVGLPDGTMGNSEVGHITIGAGRIVNQFLRRFEIQDWNKNTALANFISDMKNNNGTAHLMGLMSDGRVHSDIAEIIFIAKKITAEKIPVCIHFFSDGRDTPPKSARKYIDRIFLELAAEFDAELASFGTLIGRYYAMDRNDNMDRTTLAVNAIANAVSEYWAGGIYEALEAAYVRDESDEFIKPTLISGGKKIQQGDGIIFGNYRSDRARQILRELLKTKANILGFSQYGEGLDEKITALLPDEKIENTLGDVLEKAEKTQLRIAETEKYNHVTYFFDAERTLDYKGEEKLLVPSPSVATFDIKPEMSADEITKALLPRLDQFDVVILNYANADMVGHTGNLDAVIKAMETLDAQLSRLVPAVLNLNGTVLITADHGNAEKMWNEELDTAWTAHTTNKVPFLVVGGSVNAVKDGGLSDIAPTVLKILDVKQPEEMTGKSLIES